MTSTFPKVPEPLRELLSAADSQLHKLWSWAAGLPGYDKAAWKELETRLYALARPALPFKGKPGWTGKDFADPVAWDEDARGPGVDRYESAMRMADDEGLLNAMHYNVRHAFDQDGKMYGHSAVIFAEVARRLLRSSAATTASTGADSERSERRHP